MSTRQPKKKRTRERTVTTLTDATEGSLQATHEGSTLLTPTFPLGISAPPASFPLTPTFFSPSLSMPPISGSMSASFYPLPPGQNDLEILERLKDIIKSNQHPSFKPTPKPAALASIYRGPYTYPSVPPHPEQVPEDYKPLSSRIEQEGRLGDVDGRLRKGDVSGFAQPSDLDSGNKSIEMDPPGLNAPSLADGTQRPSHLESGPASSRYGQPLSRVPTDKSLGSSGYPSKSLGDIPKTSSYESRDFNRGPRDAPWPRRNSNASQDDQKSARYDSDRNGGPRYPDNRSGQRYSRDFDRDKDRRGTDFGNRYVRDDRRNDDRLRYSDNRRPPPEQRHYEPRSALSRNDTKSSVDVPLPASTRPPDDRVLPDHTVTRPLDDRPMDSRSAPSYWEERPFDPRDSRHTDDRSLESRLSRPPAEGRSLNGRPPPLDDRDLRDRRPLPPSDDSLAKPSAAHDSRPPPPLSDDRIVKGSLDDRRPLPDRSVRPEDDRRPPPPTVRQPSVPPSSYSRTAPTTSAGTVPPSHTRSSGPLSTASADPASRPADDRRPPVPPITDRSLPPSNRPTVAPAALAERTGRPTDERRPPENYPARPRSGSTSTPSAESRPGDRAPPRPPATQDERAIARPPSLVGPAEDRNGRPPSLQERIGGKPGEPIATRSSAGDDRVSTPLDRPARPAPDGTSTTRPSDPPQPSAKLTDTRPPPGDTRPPLSDRIQQRPDDRGRPLTNDRTAPPPPRYLSKPRPVSPRGDVPRTFKPRGATPSPRRPEYRPVDRTAYPDRYERSPERRPDAMDVDRRYGERPPAGYRRPSPPPYNRDRPWSDNYANDGARRHPTESGPPHTYTREWREEDRSGPGTGFADWERRDWDRSRAPPLDRDRDYDRERDPRFTERDPTHTWDARDDRERRSTFPPPPAPAAADVPPPRPFEGRPLSARLSDGYPPPEDRDRERSYDRSRYPPMDVSPAGYSRVRMRSPSPSPIRRPGAVDDLNRPPLKRARDDAYGAPGYYTPPSGGVDPPRDYPPPSRMRTPPPPGPSGPYYDEPREYPPRGVSPTGSVRERERDFADRDAYPPYDRRDPPPLGRMPPPRSSPPFSRPAYGRDDRRYPRA